MFYYIVSKTFFKSYGLLKVIQHIPAVLED